MPKTEAKNSDSRLGQAQRDPTEAGIAVEVLGRAETLDPTYSAASNLLTQPIRVINVGLEGFATELAAQGVPVTHVQWSPPAGGDAKLAALLGKLGM